MNLSTLSNNMAAILRAFVSFLSVLRALNYTFGKASLHAFGISRLVQ